jgi:hypothetical protein
MKDNPRTDKGGLFVWDITTAADTACVTWLDVQKSLYVEWEVSVSAFVWGDIKTGFFDTPRLLRRSVQGHEKHGGYYCLVE